MSSALKLEYLFPYAEEDAHKRERVLVRPNSFEDVCDVMNCSNSKGVLRTVKAQNRVREYLRGMGELNRLGFWVLMDSLQLGRFCVRQICREWTCCTDLMNAAVVSSSWYPNSSEAGGCVDVHAESGEARMNGVIFATEIGQYARTVVPSFAMDIALSVRNAVDFVTIVDCKATANTLDLGGRSHSNNQECMLLGILVHPDYFCNYDRPRLIPLATWPMQEYE